jgi:hypothetical protein
MEWIKCSERMPADGERVLVYDPEEISVRIARVDIFGRRCWWYDEACSGPLSAATHWIPLPPPPA